MTLKIEPVSRTHNRKGFDCGEAALNSYLRNTACQQSDKGISRTFVLVDDSSPTEILGFFTLVSCEIIAEKLPRKYAKKYPSRVPAVKLTRLAVSKEAQRGGLGTHMMVSAMNRVLAVADHLGVIGFFVDAKDVEAAFYYKQYGFIPLPDNPLELFLPMATIRQALAG